MATKKSNSGGLGSGMGMASPKKKPILMAGAMYKKPTPPKGMSNPDKNPPMAMKKPMKKGK